ncbi:endonuclease/exonuclease/phosphatase family protein [Flavicella marina]|uniref:endonuclease/exonuclease/phosphatase family protein n=1 Tax=Flavicella marina TaxID=1475951 RepID=UPI001264D7E7|nr:endonuclease/exonuclease/phosphatase family protein [Flavicella marina]
MKKLSFLDKIFFFLNSVAAALLLTSYLIPYISPKITSTVSVLSLGLPLLLICNTLFMLYWMLKLKKQFLVSLIILLIGYQHVNAFIQINEKKTLGDDDLKIMSYNVRMFNMYNWTKEKNIETKIKNLIYKEDPDVVAIQEYHKNAKKFRNYPYQYIKNNHASIELCILSKYKIINHGSLDFKPTGNNAIFADIVIKSDTIRFYNLHLQSLKIDKNKDNFGAKDSKNLLQTLKKHFRIQATQIEQLKAHEKKCNYRTIFMGDFNNTAFSWVYKTLKEKKTDTFIASGSGFGKTFDYIFPFRIDFILVDESMEVTSFKNFKENYSDHFPIMSRINFSKNHKK